MIKTKITINGREYASPETIPAELRGIYEAALKKIPVLEDRDGNGIPDVVEGKGSQKLPGGFVVENHITVNNKTYRSVEEMPEDARRVYEEAMSRVLRGEGDGVDRTALHFSFKLNRHEPETTLDVTAPPGPSAIRIPGFEMSVRTALVLAVFVIIAALVALAVMK